MSDPVTEYVKGDGTGYTVRVDVLDPAETPAVGNEGYGSRTPLFVVLNDGEVYADHDRHRLVRSLPGSNDWLHEHLQRLAEEALDADGSER